MIKEVTKDVKVNARSSDEKSKKSIPIEVPVLENLDDVKGLIENGGTLKGFDLHDLVNYAIDLKLRSQTRSAHAPKTGTKSFQIQLAASYLKATDEGQLHEVVMDDPVNGLYTFYKENKAEIDAWAEANESDDDES